MTVGIRSAWFGQRVGDGIPPATFAGIGRTGACAATVIEVPARRSAALPFAAVGAACIVAGGLVAAVSALAPSEHASWAAASSSSSGRRRRRWASVRRCSPSAYRRGET